MALLKTVNFQWRSDREGTQKVYGEDQFQLCGINHLEDETETRVGRCTLVRVLIPCSYPDSDSGDPVDRHPLGHGVGP